jgi:hypothetical protein
MCGHPLGNLVWLETNELADLQERDASLVDQAPNEPLTDTKVFGESNDIEELTSFRRSHLDDVDLSVAAHGQVVSPSWSVILSARLFTQTPHP